MAGEMQLQEETIGQIVEKYIKYTTIAMEKAIGREDIYLIKEANFITNTTLVSNTFFDNGDIYGSCNNEDVKFKDFGKVIILFNDLKASSLLLEYLEDEDQTCLYAIYMYYSTKMLAEILEQIGGKVVESTGDGNYSILQDIKYLDISVILQKANNFFDKYFHSDKIITTDEWKIYMEEFEGEQLLTNIFSGNKISVLLLSVRGDLFSEYLRCLFFTIFSAFNIRINDFLSIDIPFFTRVGCKSGICKITRIEIDGHIQQDKLIGSVVHRAAHQASGK